MKKAVILLVLALTLTGCSGAVFETLGDVAHVGGVQAQAREVILEFPADAAVLTAAGSDALYLCEGYTLSLQTQASGDLAATVRSLSGYDIGQLTVVESSCGDHQRYDWVWAAAGENGDVLCRGAVLDDGNFHYSLCVSADAEEAGSLSAAWTALFDSFCLTPNGEA